MRVQIWLQSVQRPGIHKSIKPYVPTNAHIKAKK